MEKIIAQGAEAKIILSNNLIIKDRVKKSYRLNQLDESIRRRRTKAEKKLLGRASKIINTPKVLESQKDNQIVMEFIEGDRLSEHLNKFKSEAQKKTCEQIGKEIAKLHDADIIHGDLTTSNMILKQNKVYLIDFGLGFESLKNEDKAVDLHLLKQALEAKHFQNWEELWKEVEKGYKFSKKSNQILEQLKKVESRGRYKEKY